MKYSTNLGFVYPSNKGTVVDVSDIADLIVHDFNCWQREDFIEDVKRREDIRQIEKFEVYDIELKYSPETKHFEVNLYTITVISPDALQAISKEFKATIADGWGESVEQKIEVQNKRVSDEEVLQFDWETNDYIFEIKEIVPAEKVWELMRRKADLTSKNQVAEKELESILDESIDVLKKAVATKNSLKE